MSVTAYPTLRLKLTVPQALKVRFLPAIPGTNAGNAAAAAQAAAAQAIAAATAATAATASKVDKAGDVMTGRLTLSADPTANLHAATKQYVDGAIGGSGDVTTSGPVLATQLAGFADTTGNVIRGVTLGVGLDLSAGTTLNLDSDLSAIAGLTGINTIYYRSSDGVWNPVVVSTGLTFAGGILTATSTGSVGAVGTPANGQFARWTTATTLEGISAATALTALGAQPLDADLTAFAALSGTNTIYYRSAADTWSPVLIGANMTFAGGTLSSSGGGGAGGVAAVGTPTNGQLARWTTATTIEGINTSVLGLAPLISPVFTGDPQAPTPATGDNDTSIATTAYVQANLAFYAPLASPVLTGDPQAPTPATADNDTSIATTAFVKAQSYATIASPTFTGDPKAPTPTAGDSDTSIATTAFVTTAIAAIPAAPTTVAAPQGRLTLQTGTPVMTTTTTGATTMYYTPYVGRMVPLWDGVSQFVMTDIGGELSQTSTDTTKSPAAVVAGAVYDFFVWNDGGVKRCTRGPLWVNNGARGTGVATTELERLNGIWVNKNNIANGPAARRGTYVGTAQADPATSTATFMWKYGSVGTGTNYGMLCVWNAYNRVLVATSVNESTGSWTLGPGGGLRLVNGGPGNQILICQGLAEDAVNVMARAYGFVNAGSSSVSTGIGLDSQTVSAAHMSQSDVAVVASSVATPMAEYAGTPSIGYHAFLWLESAGGPSAVTFQAAGGMMLKFFA